MTKPKSPKSTFLAERHWALDQNFVDIAEFKRIVFKLIEQEVHTDCVVIADNIMQEQYRVLRGEKP